MASFSGLWRAQRDVPPPPGPGEVAWSADLFTLSVSHQDDSGTDRAGDLARVGVGDTIHLAPLAARENYSMGVISTVARDAGYDVFTVDVWWELTGTPPVTGADLLLTFSASDPTSPGWITPDDVVVALGVPVDAGDPWLVECTAAANDWAFERRQAAGYVDDPDVVPSARVKQGVVLAAVHQWRSRATVGDTLVGLDQAGWPSGGWGDVNRMLGIPRAVAV